MPSASTPPIFISYRRSDAGGHAGRLADRLKRSFGNDAVFFDVDSIGYGDVFPERIDAALRAAYVVLIVVGKTWVDTLNERFHKSDVDFVRRELEISVDRLSGERVLVVPVRVDSASLPRDNELVPALQPLLAPLLQVYSPEFRADQGWDHPYDSLVAMIVARLHQSGSITSPIARRDALLGELSMKLKHWVSATLANTELARRHLHKPVSIGASISRRKVIAEIDHAMADGGIRTIVVAGEEGAGKTVALAQWLQAQVDSLDYGILFASAQEAHRWPPHDLVQFLRHGLHQRHLGIKDLEKLLREADGDWITARPWLVIVDGINEEGAARDWGQLMAAFAASSWLDVRMIVTTRTEHFDRQLCSYLGGDSYRRIVVPDFDDGELKQLLHRHDLKLSDIPSNVVPLLRRPRYFQRALAHRGKLADLHHLDFPTLVFLDWNSRQQDRAGYPVRPEEFERLLRRFAETARTHHDAAMKRHEIRDSFGDADDGEFSRKIEEFLQQRVIRSNKSGHLDIDAQLLPIGLGLLLLDVLNASNVQTRNALRELAAQWLGDQQDDINAQICEAAIAAALAGTPRSVEVLPVLLHRWFSCQNPYNPPVGGLRRIYPREPGAVLTLVEWLMDEGHATVLLRDFTNLLIGFCETDGLPQPALDAALDRWLGRHAMVESPSSTAARRLAYEMRSRQAAALDPGVAAVSADGAQCRSMALAVLSQLPHKLTPARLRRVVLSLAAAWMHRALERLCWLMRTDVGDCLPVFQSLQHDGKSSAELSAAVAYVAWFAWPVEAVRGWHTRPERDGTQPWYLELRDRLRDAKSTPAPDDLLRLRRWSETVDLDTADHHYQQLDFAIALHNPAALNAMIDVTLAVAFDKHGRHKAAEDIARFAPVLSPAQARSARWNARRNFAKSGAGIAIGNLFTAGDWQRPAVVRAASLGRRLLEIRPLADTDIDAAGIGRRGADLIARRLLRTTTLDEAANYFHALLRSTTTSASARTAIQGWLRRVDVTASSSASRDDAINWALREQCFVEAANLVPVDWAYCDSAHRAWSIALAMSGKLSLVQALRRIGPEDLPRWAVHRQAGEDEKSVVTQVLAAILAGEEVEHRTHERTGAADTAEDPPPRWYDTDLKSELSDAVRRWRSVERERRPEADWPADELLASCPELVRRWREFEASGDATARSWLSAVAELATRHRDDDAVAIVRALWKAQNSSASASDRKCARKAVMLAFDLDDTMDSRHLWNEMARELRTDNGLLYFVACAVHGAGTDWLRERIAIGLASTVPAREVEAAVLAGAAGFADCLDLVRARIEAAHDWRRDGFVFALDLADRLTNARLWYERFCAATDPHEIFGAFRAYLKLVDVRLGILDGTRTENPPPDNASEASRYWHTWQQDVDEAVTRRGNELAQTLYGRHLVEPYIGRWDPAREPL